MNCCQCGKDIPRGQRYKSPTLKNKAFCSEGCYQKFIVSIPRSDRTMLTDYIKKVWPSEPNYSLLMKQVNQYAKEYRLSLNDIRGIMKYAIDICDVCPDEEYGLGQFIPKYIEPYQDFIRKIQASRRESEDMPDILPQKVKPNKQGSSRAIKIMGDIFDEIS